MCVPTCFISWGNINKILQSNWLRTFKNTLSHNVLVTAIYFPLMFFWYYFRNSSLTQLFSTLLWLLCYVKCNDCIESCLFWGGQIKIYKYFSDLFLGMMLTIFIILWDKSCGISNDFSSESILFLKMKIYNSQLDITWQL